jgi:hypothetical protein
MRDNFLIDFKSILNSGQDRPSLISSRFNIYFKSWGWWGGRWVGEDEGKQRIITFTVTLTLTPTLTHPPSPTLTDLLHPHPPHPHPYPHSPHPHPQNNTSPCECFFSLWYICHDHDRIPTPKTAITSCLIIRKDDSDVRGWRAWTIRKICNEKLDHYVI